MGKWYIVSMCAQRLYLPNMTHTHHSCAVSTAASAQEAESNALEEFRNLKRTEDGWSDHYVVAKEIPLETLHAIAHSLKSL